MADPNEKEIHRVLVWSTKGGQGKTTIASQLAIMEGAYMCSNEPHTTLPSLFGEERVLVLTRGEDLPDIPRDVPLIYDFGGFAEDRVVAAAQDADYIIIPVVLGDSEHNQINIEGLMNTYASLMNLNSNILIVVNKCAKGHFEYVEEILNINELGHVPLYRLNRSKALLKITSTGQSIPQIIGDNQLLKYTFREPLKQLNDIITHLKSNPET